MHIFARDVNIDQNGLQLNGTLIFLIFKGMGTFIDFMVNEVYILKINIF
jgi:hypothetical protein